MASDAAGNSFTTHSVSPYISDTSPPVPSLLTNDAQGGGFLKIGDSITFILSMQMDEPHLEVSATYNSQDLQFDYILSSLGNYYQATYTVDELHPAYDGTVPPILLSSIKDRAGNEVTDSPAAMDNVVQDVQSGFDNIIPSISSVSITTTVTKTLILSDSIEFLIVATDLALILHPSFTNRYF